MQALQMVMELCREMAPVLTVIASLTTICIIPVMRKLDQINTKIDVIKETFNGHEKLDEVRFKAHETRLNDVLQLMEEKK